MTRSLLDVLRNPSYVRVTILEIRVEWYTILQWYRLRFDACLIVQKIHFIQKLKNFIYVQTLTFPVPENPGHETQIQIFHSQMETEDSRPEWWYFYKQQLNVGEAANDSLGSKLKAM